ncbi:putative U6 snRNA-associated Sm-like protein LSm4 [Erysiphe necator]|nr:putative U6 snRNA-associated Sm-like protein LSm4 [Erysiphe necator]
MLPLGLLTAAQGFPMLVELKNGETLNGHLVSGDIWMNLTMKEVVQTSPDGDKFYRLAEVYVKGSNVGSRNKILRFLSSNTSNVIGSDQISSGP